MSFPASMQPQQVGIPDFSTVDPATLAPMDLYDSIFWGKRSIFYFSIYQLATISHTASCCIWYCVGGTTSANILFIHPRVA